MSQVIDIEPVEGITNTPQSQLFGVTYRRRDTLQFGKEKPPIYVGSDDEEDEGGMEEAKSDGSICGLREDRSMA